MESFGKVPLEMERFKALYKTFAGFDIAYDSWL